MYPHVIPERRCCTSDRLELKIASLELNGRIISFGYEAYDIDGSKGIYYPDVVSTGVSLLQSRNGERTVSVPAGYTFFIMKKTEQ